MFSAGKKRFTGGFLFIPKKAILMQKAARGIKNRAGFDGLFWRGLARTRASPARSSGKPLRRAC